MLSEWVEPTWRQRRGIRKIHVVAILSALAAAGAVFGLFSEFGISQAPTTADRQLIASVDLRIGSPALASTRGEAKARLDVEAGELKLQTVGLPVPPTAADLAKAERLKRRYGIAWVNRGEEVSPQSQAYVDSYNRVAQAEIERRHGKQFLERLLQESGVPRQEKAVTP